MCKLHVEIDQRVRFPLDKKFELASAALRADRKRDAFEIVFGLR